MRKSDIQKLRDKYVEGSVLTKHELDEFIDKELSFKTPSNRGFAVFDLVRAGVIYQLDTNYFKVSSRKAFRLNLPDEIRADLVDFSKQYPKLNVCAWETESLNTMLEMQLLKNIIYVEVERDFEPIIEGYLGSLNHYRIFVKSAFLRMNTYDDSRPIVIIKPLITKAPVNKKRQSDRIGHNVHYFGSQSTLSTPKIEKIIVDLFSDSTLDIFDESLKTKIVTEALSRYTVNFKTLFSYARNRNKKEYLKDFIRKELRFDIRTGEFFD